jgi:hypothetical protein
MIDTNQQNRGQWVYVDAKYGADQIVMRLRIDRPVDGDIDSYSTAVAIKWEYPRQKGTASPPADLLQQMEVLGEALVPLGWATGCSYLMNVGTGLGRREWCYYTRDRAEFMRRFNALLAGHSPYPLKIEFYDDAEWKVWRDLRFAYERAVGPPAARADPPVRRTGAAGLVSGIRKWFRRGPGR